MAVRTPMAASAAESESADGNARPASELRPPALLFWAAFLVRVLYITVAHTYRFRPLDHYFGFGWEMGRVARALVEGRGYADPFCGHTGPTSWVTPLYPLLMAAVFKLFGVYTQLSGWVILTLNSLFSALTACFTWEIGARCFGAKVGRWAGWLWALYPAAMQYAVRWPWEMTLTTFLFAWSIALALRMRGVGEGSREGASAATAGRWALFGLLWGLIALSNPSLLSFLPFAGIWVLAGNRPHWTQQLPGVLLGSALCLACLAPWTFRNWRVFHHFVPLRANFGAELYLGNGPGSTGFLMEFDHPFQDPQQLRLYTQMGEWRYAQFRGALAKEAIRRDPSHFLANTLKRIDFFWFSVPHPSDDAGYVEWGRLLNYGWISVAGLLGLALALRRHAPAAWLFLWAFITLPAVYYLVTVHARFRHPLEPLIAVLGVYLFQSAELRMGFSRLLSRG